MDNSIYLADLKELRADNRREAAKDQEKWRRIASDANIHFGLLPNDEIRNLIRHYETGLKKSKEI